MTYLLQGRRVLRVEDVRWHARAGVDLAAVGLPSDVTEVEMVEAQRLQHAADGVENAVRCDEIRLDHVGAVDEDGAGARLIQTFVWVV